MPDQERRTGAVAQHPGRPMLRALDRFMDRHLKRMVSVVTVVQAFAVVVFTAVGITYISIDWVTATVEFAMAGINALMIGLRWFGIFPRRYGPTVECECPHDRDKHVISSPVYPPVFGWRTCPVPGCMCFAAWGVAGMKEKEVAFGLENFMKATGMTPEDLGARSWSLE